MPTPDPVSPDEMIAAVRLAAYWIDGDTSIELDDISVPALNAVLATLERHERAMAVVEAAREALADSAVGWIYGGAIDDAIAAFDAAGEGESDEP